MNVNFTVERVTLHLINKKDDKLSLADHEINMNAFTRQEDSDAITAFFTGHLQKVWDAPEGNTIRAARFLRNSEIRKQYSSIKADTSQFRPSPEKWRSRCLRSRLGILQPDY